MKNPIYRSVWSRKGAKRSLKLVNIVPWLIIPKSWCFNKHAIRILPTFSTGWSAWKSTGNTNRFCLQYRSAIARNLRAVGSSVLLSASDWRKGFAGSHDDWREKGSFFSVGKSFSFLLWTNKLVVVLNISIAHFRFSSVNMLWLMEQL